MKLMSHNYTNKNFISSTNKIKIQFHHKLISIVPIINNINLWYIKECTDQLYKNTTSSYQIPMSQLIADMFLIWTW
jgi:hypothetical protein